MLYNKKSNQVFMFTLKNAIIILPTILINEFHKKVLETVYFS